MKSLIELWEIRIFNHVNPLFSPPSWNIIGDEYLRQKLSKWVVCTLQGKNILNNPGQLTVRLLFGQRRNLFLFFHRLIICGFS